MIGTGLWLREGVLGIHSLGLTQGHDWEGHSSLLEVVEKRTFLVTRRSRIVRRLCHLLGKLHFVKKNSCSYIACMVTSLERNFHWFVPSSSECTLETGKKFSLKLAAIICDAVECYIYRKSLKFKIDYRLYTAIDRACISLVDGRNPFKNSKASIKFTVSGGNYCKEVVHFLNSIYGSLNSTVNFCPFFRTPSLVMDISARKLHLIVLAAQYYW